MYYENFEILCKRDGVKPSDVSKATGISTATLTSWKQGKYTPKQDKLQLIADYFNSSVDFIINGKDEKFNTEMADLDADVIFLSKEIKEYAIKLSKLSEDDRKDIMKMIDRLGKWGVVLWSAINVNPN